MERFHEWRKFIRYDKILILLFLLSLPLVNPWVRGDGVGYYAYARALVVNSNLRFEQDWIRANKSFSQFRVSQDGKVLPDQYTATGHLDNHFTIGPALDWMPFLFLTHLVVRSFDHFGGRIPANGFSWPYISTISLVTAFAGFLGIFFSFLLARKYFPERWAFLAAVGIWFASSLPVYMYFNPSWSHAHSAFAVAIFLWYWDRTRGTRTVGQWAVLGLLGALMLNMYYPNAIFLLVPLIESIWLAKNSSRTSSRSRSSSWFSLIYCNALFALVLIFGFFPTLITRWIIYGSPFQSGYFPLHTWHWSSPLLGKVLFSSDHGLLSWTPILLLSAIGLIPLIRRDRLLGGAFIACALVYYYVIASYPDWDGISSFGNRFFISLTPIFMVGLAALLDFFARACRDQRRVLLQACTVISLLILWNAGFIFQWGLHLIPDRGDISWGKMAHNQFRVVPEDVGSSLKTYFTRRGKMMQGIEAKDLSQLRAQDARTSEGGK